MVGLLWFIATVLIVLWLLGFIVHVAFLAFGPLIHLLLIVAIVIIVYNLITGRRTV